MDEKYRSGGQTIKRHISKGLQVYDTDQSVWPVNKPIPKLEALVQCSGEATFANDLPAQINEVFGAFVTADVNAGSVIDGFDTTDAFVSFTCHFASTFVFFYNIYYDICTRTTNSLSVISKN